jgi:hypothetical protein
MKPFDLKAALAGAPVVTVSGMPVTSLHLFEGVHQTNALFGVCDGGVESWSDDGRFNMSSLYKNLDLRMAED